MHKVLSRFNLFAAPKHPVLSFAAHAHDATPERQQTQFEVLVRHLLYRFFHNELLASDDETKRVMQISYAVALPGLLVALFLFPAYHAFPPYPLHRPFWPQVGDHYFYVMYSFVVMGAATVYEWDLLFPDLLEVFVLSVLPFTNRRLFFARVLALAIFLALVLLGTSVMGIVTMPLIAELPNPGHHLLAHTVAVLMSGAFAAATFLALQGILLNAVGERVFRRLTPLLQGGSIMLLLAILLLYPTLSRSLQPLLNSGSAAVRWFPPFWFLGVYERVLAGGSVLPVFTMLARTGCGALALTVTLAIATYPLAYRRRVRQLIEGAAASKTSHRMAMPLHRLLHATILRSSGSRAIYHFISQTVLRSKRHRVMLSMYGGLGIALTLANMVVLQLNGRQIRPMLLPFGIRAAVPVVVFWTVVGLRAALIAPIDRRGAWLFRVLIGTPRPDHLEGARNWVTLLAALMGLVVAVILHVFSPETLKTPLITAGQLLVAVGVSVLLADILLLPVRTFPFTSLRKSSITDFPSMVFRYFVLFPIFIALVVHYEAAIESSPQSLIGTALLLAGSHQLMLHLQLRAFQSSSAVASEDEDEFPQRLGLRDA